MLPDKEYSDTFLGIMKRRITTYNGTKVPKLASILVMRTMAGHMSQALRLVRLLLPIFMIGLVNAATSYSYLKLEKKTGYHLRCHHGALYCSVVIAHNTLFFYRQDNTILHTA
jgi:hypothetical protein